jgi:Zn-dependent protease with chaperone function
VELTRDNQSMISALRKISSNSYVAKANDNISSFFIADPKSYLNNYGVLNQATENTKKIKTSIRDSHPSIDDRISRLQQY